MSQQNNIVITRGTLGRVGSWLGGVGVLLTVLGLIQGGLSAFTVIALILAIAGIGLWAFMAPHDFRDFITGRQMRQGTVAFFSVLLVIGIVALVYLFVERAVITVDMTEGTRFSLSSETQEVLQAVNRSTESIRILGFYRPDQLREREVDDQYFRVYETETDGKIQRVYIDPLEQPAIAAPYADAISAGVNVFITYVDDEGRVDYQRTVPVVDSGTQERDMTEALAKLLLLGEFRVYFDIGLEGLDPRDPTPQGMATINGFIRANGIITEVLNLQELASNGQTIPDDASALILAQPKRQMTEAEVQVVDDYLQRGGSLFILADIFLTQDNFLAEGSVFNTYLTDNYGLHAMDAVVVDPAANSQTELNVLSSAVFVENDIGIGLNIEGDETSRALFRISRPIDVRPHDSIFNGRVIMTTPFSWGETNFDALISSNEFVYDEGDDIEGPLTTVAWAFSEETGEKIVIVGDADFATNGQIESPQGNATLFLNSMGWMTGFTERVSFTPQILTTGLPVIFISTQTLDIIAFITIILMPGTMLVLAGLIAGRRYRK